LKFDKTDDVVNAVFKWKQQIR